MSAIAPVSARQAVFVGREERSIVVDEQRGVFVGVETRQVIVGREDRAVFGTDSDDEVAVA